MLVCFPSRKISPTNVVCLKKQQKQKTSCWWPEIECDEDDGEDVDDDAEADADV